MVDFKINCLILTFFSILCAVLSESHKQLKITHLNSAELVNNKIFNSLLNNKGVFLVLYNKMALVSSLLPESK